MTPRALAPLALSLPLMAAFDWQTGLDKRAGISQAPMFAVACGEAQLEVEQWVTNAAGTVCTACDATGSTAHMQVRNECDLSVRVTGEDDCNAWLWKLKDLDQGASVAALSESCDGGSFMLDPGESVVFSAALPNDLTPGAYRLRLVSPLEQAWSGDFEIVD